MKPWARYLLGVLIGLTVGLGFAVHVVRAGAMGSNNRVGPWASGTDFGSKSAGARTRAVVALRGLLALPASEARYYTADTDDTGQPLDGRCTYRVSGGTFPARWWSITIYDAAGYLVPNQPNIYSLGSMALPPIEQGGWTLIAAPKQQPGHWLPTGGIDHFALTLRTYLPSDGGQGSLARGQLPSIVKQGCA